MAIILGIESSCDETSIAIIKDGELLSNVVATQIEMHQQFGGVMPELASRLHCENALYVLDEALRKANVTLDQIDAFAFTRGPGLIGALHIGMQVAVTNKFRGQGIATHLLSEMEHSFPKEIDDVVETITLEVRESNEAAKALYLKNGYELVVVKKNYYKDGENALYMLKRL